MRKSSLRICLLLWLILGLCCATSVHAVEVTFRVHMAQQMIFGLFDPTVDSVDLAGTFNGWGNSPLTPLADADGDSIYDIALDGFTPGEPIEYKFRINGLWDGTEEFPGYNSNRLYTVQAGENLIDVWYNDFIPGSTEVVTEELQWWNDAVFYEILVRSFCDSDGDGIGDLPGLTSKLDYLNDGDPATDDDLGITGIWLMPINESPSYHGYDSTDYYAIDPDYGTMADFEAFLAAAHARGIKVIVDYVMNHCSNQHPWFVAALQNDPQYRDWFRWSGFDPGQIGPWNQQVWHWSGSDYYYGLFNGGMPDLNYETPAVKTEMFDTATYWLDTVGVDGFRLDAVLYIEEGGDQLQSTPGTLQFWQDFNSHVKAVNPDVLSVGEAWTSTSTVIEYATNDRLDFCFEFYLSYAVMDAVNYGDASYLNFKAAQVYGLYPYLQFGTFLTNHDQNRSFEVLGNDLNKAKVTAGLYLTMPGVPFVYYGEEIGMVGGGYDEYKRSPMQWSAGSYAGFSTVTPWQPLNGNYPQYNVATEESDPASLLNWYKQLIRLRNDNSALRSGTYASLFSSSAEVMAFLRQDGNQTLLCLANTSGNAQSAFSLSGLAGWLTPHQYASDDLLNPANSGTMTVMPDHQILDLQLDGYEVRVYQLVTVTGVDLESGDLPRTGLRLEQNHPNPFNPTTTIRYNLPAASHVRISVFDLAGREVAVLADEQQIKGPQEVRWDGNDHHGRSLSAGVYITRLESDHGTRQAKITLVK